MCDVKATTFFRPWNIVEPINETSTIPTIDTTDESRSPSFVKHEETRNSPSYIKHEEDNESVLSASTCEESLSATSLSETETSSGASRRRRRRRRSESSANASTRSCSVNSEDATEGGSSLDMLSNFVFNSPPVTDYSVSSVSNEHHTSYESAFSPTLDHHHAVNPAYHADYLHRMALQQSFAQMANCSPCLMPKNEPGTLQSSTTSTIGQPFYYGFPGVQFPQGLYTSSVEEAVDLIHRQDAVAKQMKKLRPKKFRCEHCDVAFSNNGQLKGHIRIHTGERPFKCDAEGCGKSFTRNEELTRHKRIHTGLRPHSCVLCGKRFGRKDHLKKHTRTHDSRDPYRVSAAAFGVLALGHTLPQRHSLPPYVYPI